MRRRNAYICPHTKFVYSGVKANAKAANEKDSVRLKENRLRRMKSEHSKHNIENISQINFAFEIDNTENGNRINASVGG